MNPERYARLDAKDPLAGLRERFELAGFGLGERARRVRGHRRQ